MVPGAQIIHVPAGVGIDQSLRAEHVQPGQANLYAQNVRLTHSGGLEKRPAFTALTSNRIGSGTRSAGHRLASLGRALVATDGSVLDTYSPASTEWSPRGRISECTARRYNVAATSIETVTLTGDAERASVAYGSGYYLVAAMDTDQTGTLYPIVHVVDATTKRVVFSDSPATGITVTTFAPRIIVVGTTAILVWTSSGKVSAATLDLTSVSSGFSSVTDLATDANSTLFDVLPLSSTFALAYENNGGGTTRITLKTFSPSSLGSAAATQTETTNSAAITALCLAGASGEELWTVWAYTGSANVKISARNTSTLSSIIATSTLMSTSSSGANLVSAGRTAADEIYVVATSADTNGADSTWRASSSIRAVNSSGSLVTSRNITYIPGWSAGSRPFSVSSRAYIELSYDDLSGGVYNTVLVDITGDASTYVTLRPVAWIAPRLNRHNPSGNPRPIAAVSSTLFANAHTIWSSQRTFTVAIAEYDFAGQRHLPVSYAGALYLTGGIFQRFDGERVYEDGFISPPRVSLANSGTGITGTFSYVAIHEYTDATGNVVWSSPSPVQSTGAITNKQVDVKVRRPVMTWKNGVDGNADYQPQNLRAVRTLLYRTANGGGVYYLLAMNAANPTSGLWSYTDTTSDASLIAGAQLYKVPGAVGAAKDRQAVGSVLHACECNGVLVVVDDSGTTLRCYAERVTGEAPWHHDNLQLPIEGDGDVVALASLDGSVIAFKRDAIFVVPVEPANANISQGGFGSPRRIAVDAGCVDPRSVLVTSLGVFFQSDRGIELLTRELSIQPVGQKIQDTFADYPNVTAAVLDVRNGLARFSLAQTGSSTVGVDVVFDLTLGEWISVDVKRGAAATAQAVSATYGYHSGSYRYAWIDSVGTVFYEDLTTWLDNTSYWVTSQWETAWIKLGLQVDQQFWQGVLLHERKTACGLTAEVGYSWADYDAGDNKVWSESELTTYTRQVELRPQAHSQGFRCRFSDTAPVTYGTGQALEFVGLSVDVAPRQGATQGTPRLAVGARK